MCLNYTLCINYQKFGTFHILDASQPVKLYCYIEQLKCHQLAFIFTKHETQKKYIHKAADKNVSSYFRLKFGE